MEPKPTYTTDGDLPTDWTPPLGERLDEIGYYESRWATAFNALDEALADDPHKLTPKLDKLGIATREVLAAYARWAAIAAKTTDDGERQALASYFEQAASTFELLANN